MPRSSRLGVKIIPDRVTQRVLSNITVDDVTGCHVSNYSVASHGYAQIGWVGDDGILTGTTAHRAAWTAFNGQIPEGVTIDHLCKNRRCVNITHLRALSNFENARRTFGRDWPLGQCRHGHPNSRLTRIPSGKIICQDCRAAWQRRYRDRKKLARLASQGLLVQATLFDPLPTTPLEVK